MQQCEAAPQRRFPGNQASPEAQQGKGQSIASLPLTAISCTTRVYSRTRREQSPSGENDQRILVSSRCCGNPASAPPMEPFSIATGILGILAGIDQAQQCMRRLRELRNAHCEIILVTEEVAEIHETLSHIPRLLTRQRKSNDDIAVANTLNTLGGRAAEKLRQLTELVPQSSFSPSTSLRLRLKEEHWRWLRNRSHIRRLQAHFDEFPPNQIGKEEMNAIMFRQGHAMRTSADSYVAKRSTGFQLLESSATIHQNISGTIVVQSGELSQKSNSTDEFAQAEFEPNARNQNHDDSQSLKMAPQLSEVSQDVAKCTDQNVAKPASKALALPPSRRSSCDAFCSCQCHKMTMLQFHGVGSQLCGSLFFCSNGMVFGFNNCTEKRCHRNVCRTFNFVYKPPRWLSTTNLQLSFLSDPKYGPEINIRLPRCIDWDSPVWKMAVLGNIEAIRDLFDRGEASPYDVNPIGGSLLHYAIDRGYFDLCRFLLDKGATRSIYDDNGIDPTKKAWELYLAGNLTHDQSIFVREFFDDDCLQARQFTVLHKIVLGLTKLDLTAMLEVSTADIDATDAEGRTCLSWAAAKACAESIEILLRFGADPNIADLYQRGPLHYVQSAKCCELLVKGGADMNSGYVLHCIASPPGNVEVMRSLVSLGADLHCYDSYGDTPLVVTAYNGYSDCALALLEGFNADDECTTELAKVFCVCVLFARYEIIQHLRNYTTIGRSLSKAFLESLAGSETETTLLKWFQETRSNSDDFEKQHEDIMQYLREQQGEFTGSSRITDLEANSLHTDIPQIGDEVFVDAIEYLT